MKNRRGVKGFIFGVIRDDGWSGELTWMGSPYLSNGSSMRTSKIKGEDPVKLIEQLQKYILKLQSAARDIPRRQSPNQFYEKLSFDFQKCRDLPPTIRAIVEDNRVLKCLLKESKARCSMAESDVQRERLRTEKCREEFDKFKLNFTPDDLDAIRSNKDLHKTVASLEDKLKRSEAEVAILKKKLAVDARRHKEELQEDISKRERAESRGSKLEEALEQMKRETRQVTLELKRQMLKNENHRKNVTEWRTRLKETAAREAACESAMISLKQRRESMMDKGACTDDDMDHLVALMLCIIEAPPHFTPNPIDAAKAEGEEDTDGMNASPNALAVEDDALAVGDVFDEDAAAVRIQCAFRRMSAKKEVERRRARILELRRRKQEAPRGSPASSPRRRITDPPDKIKHSTKSSISQPRSRSQRPHLT